MEQKETNQKIIPSFKIKKTVKKTIRTDSITYEKILHLMEKYELSFNCIINQFIDFALKNLKE